MQLEQIIDIPLGLVESKSQIGLIISNIHAV